MERMGKVRGATVTDAAALRSLVQLQEGLSKITQMTGCPVWFAGYDDDNYSVGAHMICAVKGP